MLGVSFVVFALMQLVPGDFLNFTALDPAATTESIDAARKRYGLDRPWLVQYVLYLKNIALHLDFGVSFPRQRPVFDVLFEGLGNTVVLQGAAAVFSWTMAVLLGVSSARRPGSRLDFTVRAGALVWLAIPELVLGLLCLALAANTGWFPVAGVRSDGWESLGPVAKFFDLLWHLVLPAFVAGVAPMVVIMRHVRAGIVDVLGMDFIATARAKGLSDPVVVWKHAFRNAVNPLVSVFGLTLNAFVSGALIVELLWAWPGIGRITFWALYSQDQYLALGGTLWVSAMICVGNLIADVLLALCDPRTTGAVLSAE